MTGATDPRKVRLPGGFSLPPFGLHQALAMVVVTVALWAVGMLWLCMQGAGQWVDSWQQDIRIHVYLAPEKRGQLNQLAKRIREIDGVAGVRTVEQAEAVAWLHSWIGETGQDDAELAQRLPVSLEVTPEPDAGEFLFADLRDEAERFGAEINDDERYLIRAQKWIADARIAGGLASLLLALAMAVIISNTLRMLLLARADEVQLMRLLGAQEWFVRMPFVLEGLLLGAASGLVAWLLGWPAILGVDRWLEGSGISLHGFFLLPPLVLGGACVGTLGALIATARLSEN